MDAAELIVRPPLVDGFQRDADEVHSADFSLEVLRDEQVWMAIGNPREPSGRVAIVVTAEWKWWRPWRPTLRVIVREE